MAKEEHLAILRQGIVSWNEWRDAHPTIQPDLSRADLRATDFTGANLERANLRRAQLAHSKFREARLWAASFREADLAHADLQGAIDAWEERFAGANLEGARLPDPFRLLSRMARVEDHSGSCLQIFLSLTLAGFYTGLTIATTTDARLVSDSASSPLPILGTPIPIAEFYLVAPFVLLTLYGYLHLSLQRLWSTLGELPAFFQDGERLDQKSHPRVLSGFIRTQCALLRSGCPFHTYVHAWLFTLFIWGSGPLLLAWVWWRYLPRREWFGAVWLLGVLIISLVLGLVTYRLATLTLRGEQARLYREVIVALVLSACIVGVFYSKVWKGESPDHQTRNRCVGIAVRGTGVWERVREALRCAPFANLSQAELSVKPPAWKGPVDNEFVQGASLQGKNLQYARAVEAFVVKADLSGANLSGATLQQADLQQADLSGANLSGATLQQANLQQAQLRGANLAQAYLLWAQLQGADLRGAILQGAILREAKLTGARFNRFNNCNQRCLMEADLRRANLVNADLECADLKEVNLERAELELASLLNAQLQGANLREANLKEADLQDAQFSSAQIPDLKHCVDEYNACAIAPDPSELPAADLENANLRGANLQGADLRGANLRGVDLRGANLRGVDLRGVVGITLEQLSAVKTLYRAQLDSSLLEQLQKTYPQHLQAPAFAKQGSGNPSGGNNDGDKGDKAKCDPKRSNSLSHPKGRKRPRRSPTSFESSCSSFPPATS
jgi:uncharacterized protein YjbI with pentapeptide repeats